MPTPMRFEWVREGPAEKCANQCREWIAASGSIVESSVRDFEAFARQREVKNAMLVLDSAGGAVVQALALGREFRRFGLTTIVGKTIRLSGEDRAVLFPRANCNSMCVFLLLGGVRRIVPDEARVLVHQIWPSAKRDDANAANYSAGNLIAIQRVLGLVARYVIDMGASIELFEIATRIPPWEELRPLSRDELKRLRVTTEEDAFTSERGPAAPPNVPVRTASAEMPIPPPTETGWQLTERDGQRVLVRTHPLTIEGQQIGSFELAFSCGERADVYQVDYRERRTLPPSSSDRLDAVGISARNSRELMRTLLKVASSNAGKPPAELVSSAQGIVSGALLAAVASGPQTPLVIATTTTSKLRTAIRLGPAGLSEAFATLSAGCAPAR
jgi:hypothetical protein